MNLSLVFLPLIGFAGGAYAMSQIQQLNAATPNTWAATPAPVEAIASIVVSDLPTIAEPEFKPVVKAKTIRTPPTHGHLWEQIQECGSDDCAQAIAASTGLNEVDAVVAIYGTSRTVYTAQLEPNGPWVENPDLDGNGYWNEHDRALLMALASAE